MKLLRSTLAVALVGGLLTGCTLVTHLGAPPASSPPIASSPTDTGAPDDGPTVEPTGTNAAPPVTDDPGPGGDRPERVNVQLELGVAHDIIGKNGEVVGTITVTDVQDHATCPNPNADANKHGKFVVASFTVTGAEGLRDEDDAYYGRNFDLSKIDIIDPWSGMSITGGLDFDCLQSGTRMGTVQPGRTETGSLAYDVDDKLFTIGWFYGHQYFYVPPSEWQK